MFLNNEEKLSSGKRLHIGRMNKIWSHTRNSISIRNLKMESKNWDWEHPGIARGVPARGVEREHPNHSVIL